MAVALLNGQVLPLDDALQPVSQGVPVEQVAHADGLLHELVRIDRGDAPAGGAELLVAQPVLFQTVQQLVVGHADGGPVADLQVLGGDLNAALPQALCLAVEMLKVDDDTGAQDVYRLIPEDAGGHKIQNEFALFIHHGVSGVIAALIAHNDVVLLAEQVHHTALALVAPVCTYDRC